MSELCKSLPKFYRAVGFKEYGSPEKVLRVFRLPLPQRAPDCGLLLKTAYSAFNPSDLNQVEGVYPIKPRFDFPFGAIGGNEFLGQVVAVGTRAVDPLTGDVPEVGEWVISSFAGAVPAWSEYAVCDSVDKVVRLGFCENPYLRSLPFKLGNFNGLAAATIAINPGTAYCMLRELKSLNPGQVVIQNGANSAVGQYVIQMAKLWGLKTVNIVRDRETKEETIKLHERMRALGADMVLNFEELGKSETRDAIKELGGGLGALLALNCVGGKSATRLFQALDVGGEMVTYGAMSKEPLTLPNGPFIFKNLSARGYWFSNAVKSMGRENYQKLIREIVQMYVQRALEPASANVLKVKEKDSESYIEQVVKRAISSKSKTVIQWGDRSCL